MEIEFEGAPIKMEPKLEYIARKQKERHEKPNSPHNVRHRMGVWEGGDQWLEVGITGSERLM